MIFTKIGSAIDKALKKFWNALKTVVAKIVHGILNFARNVVKRFQELNLKREKDIPFVMDLKKCPELREKIKNAPHYDCGIFTAVYDANAEQITNYETIVADDLDETTKDVLGHASEDGIVVLT